MQKEIYKLLDDIKAEKITEFSLTYDSPSETLEPVYYWLLDFMQGLGLDVEKIVDNFTASPGSGYFAELGKRATVMQQQAMDILGKINLIIKSIINLIYDLKQFEIRIELYDKLKNDDKAEQIAALNSLKELWITHVDVKKGRGAINMLATQLEFVTIRDAFFAAKSAKDVDKLDLNERVKNILKSRYIEFETWLKQSERELRQRFNIEKTYLKSQVASMKLYTKWMMPYLKAAEQLSMKESKSAALVSAFSTMVLELLLMAKKKFSSEDLPERMRNQKTREFYSIILVDFSFRGIPRAINQSGHYAFGGRIDVTFKAYTLREDELEQFKKKIETDFMDKTLKLLQDLGDDSLKQLHEDIEHFLEEGKPKEEEKKEKETKEKKTLWTDFMDFFGLGKKKTTKQGEKSRPDSYYEKVLRKVAENQAASLCFKVYDVYKKSHGMASYPSPYEE